MKIIKKEPWKEKYDAEKLTRQFVELQMYKHVTKETINQHIYALRALHEGVDGIPTMYDVRRCLPPNMGSAYFNKRLNTYRQYFRMLLEEGRTLDDPTKNMKYKKKSYRIKNYEECNIKKFLEGFDQTTFAGFRSYVMVLLIIDSGIRPSEIVQIKETDIDIDSLTITLRAEITKSRKRRVIPISPFVLDKIRELKSYELPQWGNEYLFCSSSGKPITATALRRECLINSYKTGVSLTPYDFRHIFATTYVRNGGDVFTLQRILGHASPRMTMIYVNLNVDDLIKAHKRVDVLGNFIQKRIGKL